MRQEISRRTLLAALASAGGSAAFGAAPVTAPRPRARPSNEPPPADALIEAARLGGEVTFAVVDVATGEMVEARSPVRRMPPASVAKAPTALYAYRTLGGDHRFRTELLGTGPVIEGRLAGDLILRGGGDPTLDTDALAGLAAALKEAGVREITGTFRTDAQALPELPFIDGDQPDHVGYNPAVSALNLNYNRVHFEWARRGSDYDVTMQARAREFSPGVDVARMEIVDRSAPVYDYVATDGVDRWSVARGALGKEGARWLPVRRPAAYAGDVFRTLARSQGIILKAGPPIEGPVAGSILGRAESAPLSKLLTDMLDYSTNLTAELTGLSASMRRGGAPETLAASAARMNAWLAEEYGLHRPALVDHSGLGYDNRLSALDMARCLARSSELLPMLEDVRVDDDGTSVLAKTGTLNFVSALAGYMQAGERPLAFAIFTADVPRRDAIPIEGRERPPGARSWASRSRRLQRELIGRWSRVYAA